MRHRNAISICLFILTAASSSCASARTRAPGATSATTRPSGKRSTPVRFEMSHPGMGTRFRVVAYCPDDKAAARAEAIVLRTVAQLEEVFDEQRPSSEVYQVHANAGIGTVHVSSDLFGLLREASKIGKRSGGALDLTAGAYAEIWSRAIDSGAMPPEDEMEKADELVGADKLKLDAIGRTIHLTRAGVRLDLREVAIAYGCDAIVSALAKAGMPSALVEAGQRIAVGSAPPGRKGWRIQIDDAERKAGPRFVTISDRAIASSGRAGDVVQIEGKEFARLFDPRTGIGATDTAPVTVVARRCWQATCLARAAAVMGEADGADFIKATPGAAGWFHNATNATTRPHKK